MGLRRKLGQPPSTQRDVDGDPFPELLPDIVSDRATRDGVPAAIEPSWTRPALVEAAPQPSSTEQRLAAAIRLMSLPRQTWGSLHGLYEIVKSDLWPWSWRALTALDVSERELEDFRRALRIGGGRGHLARFSKRPPMTLEEADEVMRRMLGAWLRSKASPPAGGTPSAGEAEAPSDAIPPASPAGAGPRR
jgi:hypothetical protein